jgi:hypothetical protein
MQYVFKMDMTQLGSYNLKEHLVEATEGMRACQDYGKDLSDKLGS